MTDSERNDREGGAVGVPPARYALEMLRLLVGRHGARMAVSTSGLALAAVLNGIGIAALLPLLSVALEEDTGSRTPIHDTLDRALGAVGIETSIGSLLMLIVGVMLLKAMASLLIFRQVAHSAAHAAADARLRLVRASIAARWEYFNSLKGGGLSSVLGVEAQRVAAAYNTFCKMFSELANGLIYVAIATLVSWPITIAAAATGAVIAVVLKGIIGRTRLTGHQLSQQMTAFSERLIDGLGGMKALKAMGEESRLEALLSEDVRSLEKSSRRLTTLLYSVHVLLELLAVVVLAAGIYFLIGWWGQPIYTVAILAILFSRTIGSLNSVTSAYHGVVSAEGGFQLVDALTLRAEAEREIHRGTATSPFKESITVSDVSFSYGDSRVLSRTSFKIPFGKFVAIYGPSGVGKTTTADLIAGLLSPSDGEVEIDGVPMEDLDIRQWRATIGYVPQENILFHESVLTNVTLGNPKVSRGEASAALRAAGAWEFVASLPEGMDSVVGERGGRLSGGQRQRLAIARALARNPKLLILDEATTALDPKTEEEIIRLLRQLVGKVTILAISHQPAITRAADIVLLVETESVGAAPVQVAGAEAVRAGDAPQVAPEG